MRRIVVADDDLHVRQTIGVWLKEHGFRVSFADGLSGPTALDNATFDLMIVDVFMPHMRGFEAIRLFRERAPTVPLMAISGEAFSESAGSEFLRLATQFGAARDLRKPFKPRDLLGEIDECRSEAEPHRRQLAALGAVADSPSELHAKPAAPDLAKAAPRDPRRFSERLS
jgi:CheY-like chemotaxis protein